MTGTVEEMMWRNEGGMISAAGVRYAVGKLTASRFHRCMGRVPSDEKIPDDMSAEGKCTVRCVLVLGTPTRGYAAH